MVHDAAHGVYRRAPHKAEHRGVKEVSARVRVHHLATRRAADLVQLQEGLVQAKGEQQTIRLCNNKLGLADTKVPVKMAGFGSHI